MPSIYLDTNILIDIFEQRRIIDLIALSKYNLRYSPLSIHIYMYLYKKETPFLELNLILQKLQLKIVPFSEGVLERALEGPTKDFEDNVQLQSAREVKCDYFLTNDGDLHDMKIFEGVKIIERLPQ